MKSIFKDQLISLAKYSIQHGLLHEAPGYVSPRSIPFELRVMGETCVSLYAYDKNIGCIHNYGNAKELYYSVLQNAYSAGFEDFRFRPVNANILTNARISIHQFQPEKRWLTVSSIHELVSQIKVNDSLLLIFNQCTAIMMSSYKIGFENLEHFVQATREKANIHPSVPWQNIRICLLNTSLIVSKHYTEIQ